MICFQILNPLSETIHRSFGEQINYDDDSDPAVRRLKFYANSPSPWHSSLYESCREDSTPRSYLLYLFRLADQYSTTAHIPGAPGYAHQQWLKSIRYDPNTYEILGPRESSETAEITDKARIATARTLDTATPDRPGKTNVLHFRPRTAPDE